MPMSAELSFVDTNVLVYALYEEVEHHVAARHLVDRAKQSDAALCTAPQVLPSFTRSSPTRAGSVSPWSPARQSRKSKSSESGRGLRCLRFPTTSSIVGSISRYGTPSRSRMSSISSL